jgi:hypothetical protein
MVVGANTQQLCGLDHGKGISQIMLVTLLYRGRGPRPLLREEDPTRILTTIDIISLCLT